MRILKLVPALVALSAFPAQAGDTVALSADCDGCHGPLGASVDSDIPIIGGQSVHSIKKALEQFRDWSRPCRRSPYRHGFTDRSPRNMCEISESLDSEEIESLAQYYGSQDWVAADQPFDQEKALAGSSLHTLYCITCHPNGGSNAGYAGRLAGQWGPYLKAMTEQISTGEWRVPKIMQRKMSSFSEEEVDALLNFFASRQD